MPGSLARFTRTVLLPHPGARTRPPWARGTTRWAPSVAAQSGCGSALSPASDFWLMFSSTLYPAGNLLPSHWACPAVVDAVVRLLRLHSLRTGAHSPCPVTKAWHPAMLPCAVVLTCSHRCCFSLPVRDATHALPQPPQRPLLAAAHWACCDPQASGQGATPGANPASPPRQQNLQPSRWEGEAQSNQPLPKSWFSRAP